MQVRLISHEGEEFLFPCDLRNLSGFAAGLESDDPVDLYALDVTSWALRELQRYCEHHLYASYEPFKGKGWPEDVTDVWDCTFLEDLDLDRLQELVTAAQHLVMTTLYQLILQFLAWRLRQEQPDELCEDLKLREEVNEAESQWLQWEFPWFNHIRGDLVPSGQSKPDR